MRTLVILLSLSACGPRIPDGAREAVVPCEVAHTDPYTLLAARVVDEERLELDLEHGGGCEAHDFYTCWDGEFLENDPAVFSEANPPRATIHIGHDANGDGCEALERHTATFFLTPLREAYEATHDNGANRLVLLLDTLSAQYAFPQ